MTVAAAAILRAYLTDGGPAGLTLMRLAMALGDDAALAGLLAAAAPEAGDGARAARLAALAALVAAHPAMVATSRAVAAAVPQGAAGATPEAAVAAIAAGFDRAVALSPAASVALYSLGDPALLSAATDEVVEALDGIRRLGPGVRVLDVGCGTGRLAVALAGRGVTVLGIDPSAEMVAAAGRAAAGRPGLRFRRAPAHAPGTDLAAAFDLVVALDSFPYVVQAGGDLPARSFEAAAGALRPGGSLVVLNLSYRGDPDRDAADARCWARAAGLEARPPWTPAFAAWDGRVFVFDKPAEPAAPR